MNSFITGSMVYGKPNAGSDIDLVVLISTTTDLEVLKNFSDNGDIPIRYGRLNLIVLTDQREFDAWLAATYKCMSLKPCSRETAIEIIDQEYIARGLPP